NKAFRKAAAHCFSSQPDALAARPHLQLKLLELKELAQLYTRSAGIWRGYKH
ncbi:hypothetical protein HaLaN_20131, partial [Haematococcus lacustris]